MVSIAFLGNSMFYYNDCPRMVQQMLAESTSQPVVQDSCLLGGSSLTKLWNEGNGMMTKFASPSSVLPRDSPWGTEINGKLFDTGAPSVSVLLSRDTTSHKYFKRKTPEKLPPWNYCFVNDFTQNPAREQTRQETIDVLRKHYLPLISSQTTVVFLQTPAYYIEGLKGTADLGDFDNFTRLLLEGYELYQNIVREAGLDCRIAPMGLAYRQVRRQIGEDMWHTLYNPDGFHASPHGTWLEACVLVSTVTDQIAPVYKASWWKCTRFRQPAGQELQPLPNAADAETLRKLAWQVVQDYKRNRCYP